MEYFRKRIIADGMHQGQGLTLVHFSAQFEPFLSLETSPKRLNPRHKYPLNTPYTPPTHPLHTPCPTKSAYVELKGGRV